MTMLDMTINPEAIPVTMYICSGVISPSYVHAIFLPIIIFIGHQIWPIKLNLFCYVYFMYSVKTMVGQLNITKVVVHTVDGSMAITAFNKMHIRYDCCLETTSVIDDKYMMTIQNYQDELKKVNVNADIIASLHSLKYLRIWSEINRIPVMVTYTNTSYASF